MSSQPGHPLHLEDDLLVVREVVVERLPPPSTSLGLPPRPAAAQPNLVRSGLSTTRTETFLKFCSNSCFRKGAITSSSGCQNFFVLIGYSSFPSTMSLTLLVAVSVIFR